MVYNVVNIIGPEIRQDGNNNCTIGDNCKVTYPPVRRVLPQKRDLVSLFDPCFLKENMIPCDLLSNLMVSKGLPTIIGKCIPVPGAFQTIFRAIRSNTDCS